LVLLVNTAENTFFRVTQKQFNLDMFGLLKLYQRRSSNTHPPRGAWRAALLGPPRASLGGHPSTVAESILSKTVVSIQGTFILKWGWIAKVTDF
jgi:hypothetical protein